MSCRQITGRNHNIKVGNKSFQSVATFKYLGMVVTNENGVHEGIKSKLNSGNSCYHAVQTFLSCRLLCKNIKIEILKTIILPVVLYGCETWSLTFGKECLYLSGMK
jgi:hypothetical protein